MRSEDNAVKSLSKIQSDLTRKPIVFDQSVPSESRFILCSELWFVVKHSPVCHHFVAFWCDKGGLKDWFVQTKAMKVTPNNLSMVTFDGEGSATSSLTQTTAVWYVDFTLGLVGDKRFERAHCLVNVPPAVNDLSLYGKLSFAGDLSYQSHWGWYSEGK